MSQQPHPTDDQYQRDCVLYLRKSKGRAGIPRQRRQSHAHAEKLRWRIVAEFVDKDATAFTKIDADEFARRDDYQAMLETLRGDDRAPALGVLAWHADRLHRNTDEVNIFTRVCAAGRHPVETPMSGGYDLTTANARKRLRDDASDAQYEVDHLTERVLAQKTEAAAAGQWLGGKVPFGWKLKRTGDITLNDLVYAAELHRADAATQTQCDVLAGLLYKHGAEKVADLPEGDVAGVVDDYDEDARVLVLHLEKAAAIAWGSEAVLTGSTLGAVAREWNGRGLRRNRGGEWTPWEVRQVLVRERNAGLYVYQGELVEGRYGNWPPIVNEEIWRAVVRTLQDPARRTTPGPDPRWLGSGLFLCGVCGNTLRGGAKSGGRGQKPIYRCRTRKDGQLHISRDAESLDAFVEMTLLARLAQPDILNLIAEEDSPDLEGIRTRLAVQEAELADWRRLALDGKVTAVSFAENETAVLARIKVIKKELVAAFRSPLLADIVTSKDVAAHWKSRDDLAWRRAVLSTFVTVTVHPVRKGRPVGWEPGTPYLDTEAITFDWRKPWRG